MTLEAHCVDPKFIKAAWPIAAPMLRPAMRKGGLGTFAALERGVLYGDSLLWLVLRDGTAVAALVTDLIRAEDELVCLITACGGHDMRAWLPLIARIEAFAVAEKCARMRLMGRKGWARMLPQYRQEHVILERKM